MVWPWSRKGKEEERRKGEGEQEARLCERSRRLGELQARPWFQRFQRRKEEKRRKREEEQAARLREELRQAAELLAEESSGAPDASRSSSSPLGGDRS
jgi:hypothetical protein